MNAFAYLSYKHQSDQDLLDRLGRAIFVLKRQAQGRLFDYGLNTKPYYEVTMKITDAAGLEHIDVLQPRRVIGWQ